MVDHGDKIASFGESNRTPEFKQAREELVGDVNSFLGRMQALQEDPTAPKGGWLLLETPRLTTTDMGPAGHNRRGMVEEFMPGISLVPKGDDGILTFQSVTVNAETGEREVVIVAGSGTETDQTYSSRAQGQEVISFEVRSRQSFDAPERYFGFTVRGDGSVHRQYLDVDDRTNVSQPIFRAEDIAPAQLALKQIAEKF